MVNWASVGLTCSERAISGRAGSVMSTASAVIAAVVPRIAVTIHEVGAGRFTGCGPLRLAQGKLSIRRWRACSG